MLKNSPGTIAPDFRFLTAEGRQGNLCQINAPYTMLFFFDPDCNNCREIKKEFASSTVINRLLEHRILKILALYPEENIEVWNNYLNKMPADWIVARDPKNVIRNKELYELQALPTIYLLDGQKRIILKDARPEVLYQHLKDIHTSLQTNV